MKLNNKIILSFGLHARAFPNGPYQAPNVYFRGMEPLSKRIIATIHIWIATSLLLLAAAIFLATHDKGAGFLQLAPYHNKAWDFIMTYYTHLGDGLFATALVLFLIWRKQKKTALLLALTCIFSGLVIAQILKELVDAPRPFVYFRELHQSVYSIKDVTLDASRASFPSGHTTTAFAILGCLVLMYPTSRWKPVWWLLAVLVGYSRMYLSNHFLLDVTVGAIIGVLSSFLVYFILQRREQIRRAKK